MPDSARHRPQRATANSRCCPRCANRHGLITGRDRHRQDGHPPGDGRALFAIGVPVFMADVKGDLAGIGQPGARSPKLTARLARIGVGVPAFAAFPVVFWDVFGEQGHPVRATVSDLGPLLLSRILQPQRHAGRRARARVQGRRRQRPAAARPEGPARDAAVRRRQRAAISDATTATSRRRRSARSSAACSRSSSRAATSSSASRC